VEPPAETNPLLSARNCLVTPHIAWATHEARARLMDLVTGNISAWLSGNSRNVIK
jgi:glycerate dehydrogenase